MSTTKCLFATAVSALALSAVSALALSVPSTAQAARPTLYATVGPGFTITLKTAAGKTVRRLKPRAYRIVVRDRSSDHNFRLLGRGVNKSTPVGFTGTTRMTVRLRRGVYRYVCDPHADEMRGSFRVA